MIPAPVHFCQSDMSYNGQYLFPLVSYNATPEQIDLARFYVTTGCSDKNLRPDMLQYADTIVAIEGSNELYLAVPHTGYCFYHNVSNPVYAEFLATGRVCDIPYVTRG